MDVAVAPRFRGVEAEHVSGEAPQAAVLAQG